MKKKFKLCFFVAFHGYNGRAVCIMWINMRFERSHNHFDYKFIHIVFDAFVRVCLCVCLSFIHWLWLICQLNLHNLENWTKSIRFLNVWNLLVVGILSDHILSAKYSLIIIYWAMHKIKTLSHLMKRVKFQQ